MRKTRNDEHLDCFLFVASVTFFLSSLFVFRAVRFCWEIPSFHFPFIFILIFLSLVGVRAGFVYFIRCDGKTTPKSLHILFNRRAEPESLFSIIFILFSQCT